MTCRQRGERIGSHVDSCCGGGEQLLALYECRSTLRPEEHCVIDKHGRVLVEIDGVRSLETVAGCRSCHVREDDGVPEIETTATTRTVRNQDQQGIMSPRLRSQASEPLAVRMHRERRSQRAAKQAEIDYPPWNGALMSAHESREYIGPPAKRGKKWLHHAQTKHAMQVLLNQAVADTHPSPPMDGRGVVTCGGGPKYFPLAYAMIRTLRQVGCTLPVEVWHLGAAEMSPEMSRVLASLGAETRDATSVGDARILSGWESKPHAIRHSRFAEVLFLDADVLPARNPTSIFSDPEYQRHGAMFWPDLPNGRVWIPGETWDVAGIMPDNRAYPAFETGQILIDKRRCWRELCVTSHANDYSDLWYEYVYGDKDTFKLAWHKCDTPYAMAPDSLWVPPCIHQYGTDGEPLFYHAVQGKALIDAGEQVPGLPREYTLHVAAAKSALRESWTGITPTTTRDELEAYCRSRAFEATLADGTHVARAIGRFLLHVDPLDAAITPHLRRSGMWESWVTLAIARAVKPGWKCVNVGANVGYFACLMAALSGETVDAFEPIPHTAELLRGSAKQNGLPINVHQLACYSRSGTLAITYTDTNAGGASIESTNANRLTVDSVRLDDAIDRADLIFIDAEGAEEHILDGAKRLIAGGARVIVEVDPRRYYRDRWLESLGPLKWISYSGEIEPMAKVTELSMICLGFA